LSRALRVTSGWNFATFGWPSMRFQIACSRIASSGVIAAASGIGAGAGSRLERPLKNSW